MPISNWSKSSFLSAIGNRSYRNAVKAVSPNATTAYTLITQSVSNSTALVAATNLSLDVVANTFYSVEGLLNLVMNGASNISLDFAGGTAQVANLAGTVLFTQHNTATTLAFDQSALNTLVSGGATTAWTKAWIDFSFFCTVSGKLQLRFSQNASGATATRILSGSWLLAYPMDHIINQ